MDLAPNVQAVVLESHSVATELDKLSQTWINLFFPLKKANICQLSAKFPTCNGIGVYILLASMQDNQCNEMTPSSQEKLVFSWILILLYFY